MAPVVDRLATEYDGVVDFFVYGDVNASPEGDSLASEHGVQYVPTMMIVGADGTELDRIIGELSEAEFRAKLDAASVVE